MSDAFKVSAGPASQADAIRFADELEKAIGEIANGKRKADRIPMEPLVKLIAFARLASAPQASQPPQGAEPAQFAEQDERGVWRTEDGFPSPENAWEAMLVARARSGHALSYSDTSRIILDLRRAALAAPPQGASSLLPGWTEQAAVDLAQRAGFSGTCWTMGPYELVHMLNMAASPLPAPQEPSR